MSLENLESWEACDLSEQQLQEIRGVISILNVQLPSPRVLFNTRQDIENLTEEEARLVMYAARRTLLIHLLMQEIHEHYCDDCGDYLDAATELWHDIFYDCELQEGTINLEKMKEILLSDPRACDGDFRYAIFSEALQDELWR